jgi:hypothetical protein
MTMQSHNKEHGLWNSLSNKYDGAINHRRCCGCHPNCAGGEIRLVTRIRGRFS